MQIPVRLAVFLLVASFPLTTLLASSNDEGLLCIYGALPSSAWQSYDLKLGSRELSTAEVGEEVRPAIKSCSGKRVWKNQDQLDLSVAYALTLGGIGNEKQTLVNEGIDPKSIIALQTIIDDNHRRILSHMQTATKSEMDSLYGHLTQIILTKSTAKWQPAAGAALVLIMKLGTKGSLEEQYQRASH